MNITLFDSFCEDFDAWKKETEEANECTLTDQQAYCWFADTIQEDWDFFLDTLDEAERRSKCARFIADGMCGLWFGQRSAGTTRESLRDLVNALCEGADEWQVKIEDGEMFVYHHHHDGTNWFKVRGITDRGINLIERTRWDFGEEEVADRVIDRDTLSVSLGKFFQ
jgi:hypothetical protein